MNLILFLYRGSTSKPYILDLSLKCCGSLHSLLFAIHPESRVGGTGSCDAAIRAYVLDAEVTASP